MTNPIERAYAKFCDQRFPLPTEQQIADLERRIGVTFPDDYRTFLLTYNGGYFIEPEIAPPVADCPLDGLTFMHGITASHPEAELGSLSDLALFSENDPPEIVPIGCTSLGSFILLIVHSEERGSIAFKEISGGCYFLADRIEEFFALLRGEDDK